MRYFFILLTSAFLCLSVQETLFASTSEVSETEAEEQVLKNQKLVDEYLYESDVYYSFGEYLLLNMFMGLLTGGIYGGAMGFFNYDSQQTTGKFNTLLIVTGAAGGFGLLAGGIIAFIEHLQKRRDFHIGKPILTYTLYSTVVGAILGSIFGVIPYTSTNDTDSIINFMSYGAALGFVSGIVFYFLFEDFEAKKDFKLDFLYEPQKEAYLIRFSKRLSF